MKSPVILFWIAGSVQLLIAAANLFLPSTLSYRENLRKVSPVIRQIFIVHSIFIVLVVLAFSALCFFYSNDLIINEPLARAINSFLAFFWSGRLLIQVFFYDSEIKRQYFPVHVCFVAAFLYLGFTFAIAALGGFS